MVLSQALRWGLLRRNAAELADAPRQGAYARHEEDEKRCITDEQARELFRAAEASRWRNYYVAAVRTGLRPGEMLGSRWGDLDLDSDPGSLRVRRTLNTRSEPVFNPPKSPAARRTVALHAEAREDLLRQRSMLRDEGLNTGAKALVFLSSAGTPKVWLCRVPRRFSLDLWVYRSRWLCSIRCGCTE